MRRMLIIENIRLALNSLWANKMRALLTMLGIIIGIASVIAILTLGDAVTGSVTSSMQSMGANNITIGLMQKDEVEETNEIGAVFGVNDKGTLVAEEEDFFTLSMIQELTNTYQSEILAISASESVGSGQILDGDAYANVTVTGVSMGYFVANENNLLAGRYFTDAETSEGRKVALITDQVVENMFGGDFQSALGKEIEILVDGDYSKYSVIGVYEYVESGFGLSQASRKESNTNVFIPLNTAMQLNHTSGYQSFTIVTKEEVAVEDLMERVTQFLNGYYRSNTDFEVSARSMSSMLDTLSTMMGTITLAIAVIAGIALLVGGIGVMNIMLVSITERTREIGTRKALGATNGSIRLQFIVEAVTICLMGGIIGIILGVIGGTLGANLLGSPTTASVSSIVISLGFAVAIGMFFGYYPANRAAKMDPIEALRYE